MIFSFEATTLQNPLLERIFQASWEMHLLFNTAYGFPNRDITRPANSFEYLLLVTSSHLLILFFLFLISVLALKISFSHFLPLYFHGLCGTLGSSVLSKARLDGLFGSCPLSFLVLRPSSSVVLMISSVPGFDDLHGLPDPEVFPGFLILAVFKPFPFYWVLFWFFY